ncbi:hypothetical protein VTO73DRAFT_3830 [Trametes versicolor]
MTWPEDANNALWAIMQFLTPLVSCCRRLAFYLFYLNYPPRPEPYHPCDPTRSHPLLISLPGVPRTFLCPSRYQARSVRWRLYIRLPASCTLLSRLFSASVRRLVVECWSSLLSFGSFACTGAVRLLVLFYFSVCTNEAVPLISNHRSHMFSPR